MLPEITPHRIPTAFRTPRSTAMDRSHTIKRTLSRLLHIGGPGQVHEDRVRRTAALPRGTVGTHVVAIVAAGKDVGVFPPRDLKRVHEADIAKIVVAVDVVP